MKLCLWYFLNACEDSKAHLSTCGSWLRGPEAPSPQTGSLCVPAGSNQAALDFGGLVDAIHVDGIGVLGMGSIATINAGPRAPVRSDSQAHNQADFFGPWPSITLDPGAQVGRSEVQSC